MKISCTEWFCKAIFLSTSVWHLKGFQLLLTIFKKSQYYKTIPDLLSTNGETKGPVTCAGRNSRREREVVQTCTVSG